MLGRSPLTIATKASLTPALADNRKFIASPWKERRLTLRSFCVLQTLKPSSRATDIQQVKTSRNECEQGFTFVELMVVIVIIAILSAIAIPVFLQQREKAWAAEVHSALKNANFAIEAHGSDQGGDYSALDGADSTSSNAPFQLIEDQGYRTSASVDLLVDADPNTYCVTAEHSLLPVTHAWQTATFSSDGGAPDESNTC